MTASWRPSSIRRALRVSKLTGKLWGGKFKADATLTAKAAGRANAGRRARLTADLTLDRADLRKLPAASDGRSLAKGFGDLRLSLSGEGLSPHGLVSVLAGQGSLRLDGGAIYGLAPQAIAKAARNFLGAPKRPDGGMARLVADEFKARRLSVSRSRRGRERQQRRLADFRRRCCAAPRARRASR